MAKEIWTKSGLEKNMKVTVPEHQFKTTLSALLLELQLTNELEQLSSAISVYQELIAFCLQYAFLFKNEDSAPIGEVFSQKQERLSTPDPARDGTNWVVYCAANPVGRWDPTGLGTLDDFAYQQRTKAGAATREAEKAEKNGDKSSASAKRAEADKLMKSADDAETRYLQGTGEYQSRVIVIAQINLFDSVNNFFYNLFVHWHCSDIESASERMGFKFKLLYGENGRAAEFERLQKDKTVARIIVIGHGWSSGLIADEKNKDESDDSSIFIINSNCVVPVIDMVGCYASSNWNYRHNQTNVFGDPIIVNTYNPNNDEIWWNQTNEALTKIRDSLLSGNPNSGGVPGVEPEKVTYWLRGIF